METTIFGNLISVYSTREAVEDGTLVLLDFELTSGAGIKYPVFVTRTVFDRYVVVPETMYAIQDETGRTWDILIMFRYAAAHTDGDTVQFKISCAIPKTEPLLVNERHQVNSEIPSRLVLLKSVIGPRDYDDPRPAIYIMLPNED
ncbi:MAG: DUF6573 family protein [Bacteroidota bacterium]